MEERNLRKVMIGTVSSDKMDKTVVVSVETREMNKLYGKIEKRTYKLKAHDENNECHVGDKVKVMETRPLSKDKRWRVVEILEKELGELKTELFKLRFSLATHGLDNPMKIKEVKKDIARINTELRQRELANK